MATPTKKSRWPIVLGAIVALSASLYLYNAQAQPTVVVYKTPTCGCCGLWVEHLEANGFKTVVHDLDDLSSIKQNHGVRANYASCHTAVVDGYVVEGHVPADAIQRLLNERPDVTGLAVPGMPIGSPGMEQGDRRDPYDVLTFDGRTGQTEVFTHVPGS